MHFSRGQAESRFLGFFTSAECDAITLTSLGRLTRSTWMKDSFMGVGIAAVMPGLIFTITCFQKWFSVKSLSLETDGISPAAGPTVFWYFFFVLISRQEEPLSKGHHLQNTADGIGMIWRGILSSLDFVFLHDFTTGGAWISACRIIQSMPFLSLGYVLTKQLWLPVGLPMDGNFFDGVIFGSPVEGINTCKLVLQCVFGPKTRTGGRSRPEATPLRLPALSPGVSSMDGYSNDRAKHD